MEQKQQKKKLYFKQDESKTLFTQEQINTIKGSYHTMRVDCNGRNICTSTELFWDMYVPKDIAFSEEQIQVVNELYDL